MSEVTTEFVRQSRMMRLIKILINIPPVVVDGAVVTCAAFMSGILVGIGSIITVFGQDTVAKLLTPAQIFWTVLSLQVIGVFLGASVAALQTLSSYRNKIFAEHLNKKNGNSPPTEPPKV